MLSRLEWLLIGIIIIQLCLSSSLWNTLRLIGSSFRKIFEWLGLWTALSVLLGWLGGKWIPRWLNAILSGLVTFLGALSGYYNGYNRGYDDAVNGRSRSWTASIHRMFTKQDGEKRPEKSWFDWFRKKD